MIRRFESPGWLSVSDYARHYGVDRGTVHKWLRDQLLETYRVGVLVRVRNIPPDQHKKASEPAPPVDGC